MTVTGGWPIPVERVTTRMRQGPFDDAVHELEAHLASAEGAGELLAAAGLDSTDPDQPADPGLVATFARLAETVEAARTARGPRRITRHRRRLELPRWDGHLILGSPDSSVGA
jgi:hypothetical protein